jgi:hypothetical protein
MIEASRKAAVTGLSHPAPCISSADLHDCDWGVAMDAMIRVIAKVGSRQVNGYVKAVLTLEAVRRQREDRYERVVRPLDRRRDALAAEVATRRRALSGGQIAAAQRLLAMIGFARIR